MISIVIHCMIPVLTFARPYKKCTARSATSLGHVVYVTYLNRRPFGGKTELTRTQHKIHLLRNSYFENILNLLRGELEKQVHFRTTGTNTKFLGGLGLLYKI